jgi:flagellar biosynthesis protein
VGTNAGSVPVVDIFDNDDETGGKTSLSGSNTGKIPKRPVAVALKESDKRPEIPRITAAGRGKIAEKILQLAFDNGIRVREDGELAEMLAQFEIDSPIPSEAFMAVAEILAYVYRANGAPNPFDALLDNAMDEKK